MGAEELRPAFYALRPGGWRDYVTVLHLPYTLWNLAYVALGASIAPHFRTDRMLWTMAAFLLALGVAAHTLDELNGRPLRTRIGSRTLVVLALAALAGACAIGVWAAFAWGRWLLVFVAVGAFLVPAYNLEWLGGRLHNEWGLALSWAAFPVLTAYFAEAQTIRAEAVLAAAFGAAMIVVQRTLSTPVRRARRELGTTAGVEPMERSLRILPWANVLLAAALVTFRLT
jgi:MFS family permease